MKTIKLLSFVPLICGVLASTSVVNKERGSNSTESDKVLSRNKRFLVFVPNGGTIKFVSGYLGPIDT